MDQQIRLADDVEPDRPDAVTLRIRELVMMTEQREPRSHCRQHIVDGRLPGVDAFAGRIERTRRFVRQEDVDRRERLAREHFLPYEMPSLVVAALPELDGRR